MQKNPLNIIKDTTIENKKMILIDLLTTSDCLLLNKGLSAFENK